MLSFKDKIVVTGEEATEWNSSSADDEDGSLARERVEGVRFGWTCRDNHATPLRQQKD